MILRNDADAGRLKKNEDEFGPDHLYLKSLLDSSNKVIIRAIDTNYCYLFFNNAYKNDIKRIYGADISPGRNIFDYMKLDTDKKNIRSACERVFSGESFAYIDKCGENGCCYYENYLYPIKDEREGIVGAILLGIDITDRKHTEEALRQSEETFRTLFMALTDGFYLSEIIDDGLGNPVDYRYLEVNPAFEKIIGLTRTGIIGKRYTELLPADTTDWLENYCKVAVTGEPYTHEFYSGEYKKYFETYAYKTAKDRIAVFVKDVTERKQTEKSLRKIQKLESLGILAGGIAHDFNNILCGLFGYIELAQISLSSHDIPGANVKLSQAMQSLDILRGLSGQLLTFSKSGAPNCTVISMEMLINGCCTLALSGSKIKCNIDIASDLAMGECDKNQMAQVLTNIIINAKQAMPSGGEICVSAKNVILHPNQYSFLPRGGKFIHIAIRDKGVGIPEDALKKIFDPFFTTKETGHGLGLSSALSIVKRHNGNIDVESEPGVGSTFHIYLPAALHEDNSIRKEVTGTYKGRGPVLVMDDDVSIRNVYTPMIQFLGHTVVVAANGEEAIGFYREALREKRPFVITFLDLTIRGGMGGQEALLEIRKLQPDAVVVAVSGYTNDLVMSKPLKAGFNDSLSKPFAMEDLIRIFLRAFRPHDT